MGKPGKVLSSGTDEAVGWRTMRRLDWLEVVRKRGTLRERSQEPEGPGPETNPKED